MLKVLGAARILRARLVDADAGQSGFLKEECHTFEATYLPRGDVEAEDVGGKRGVHALMNFWSHVVLGADLWRAERRNIIVGRDRTP